MGFVKAQYGFILVALLAPFGSSVSRFALMTPTLLDGRALAQARSVALARRAATVTRRRGRRPRLLLVAFAGPEGEASHVDGKRRRCAEVGVSVTPLILPEAIDADTALDRFRAALLSHPDGVLVQVPFPLDFDGKALLDAIPPAADIDMMSPSAIDRHERDAAAPPPLTVAAALALLDHYGVSLPGREGALVGPATPFHAQFERWLRRRGVIMKRRLDPHDPGLQAGLADASVVVLAAAESGLVPAGWLRPGAAVIDAGYFNAGGVGDLALDDGIDHLGALAPVPGGVGPMTISMLVEAVVGRAEERG
jgi:methylenetetrahydrofolate dehydrogenase (NADP+)/methenyltetrahydrofolate cyclohydrolase